MTHISTDLADQLVIVVWSYSKNDLILQCLVDDWIEYSDAIGAVFMVATDSTIIDCPNKLFFNRSSWKSEWLEVVSKLEKLNCRRFISLLDDFLLTGGAGQKEVSHLFSLVESRGIDYLALEPHRSKSNVLDMLQKDDNSILETLCPFDRYPSSLRPAIWSIELFKQTVSISENVWEFEEKYINGFEYMTVVDKTYSCRVKHIMEKGRLNYNFLFLNNHKKRILIDAYGFNWFAALRWPRALFSNVILFFFGFRLHNVFHKRSNTRL